jgi:hypothetical protein
VISLIGGTTLKSVTFRATIDEVDPSSLLSPADGASVQLASLASLSWAAGNGINNSFRVIVKDIASGDVVIDRTLVRLYDCPEAICIAGITAPDTPSALHSGKTYRWWVVYASLSGEKAKSAKWTFTIN